MVGILTMRRIKMSRIEMSDSEFTKFQDDFYNLLEKYGVTEITCDHQHFNQICEIRNKVAEFIEEEKYLNQHKELHRDAVIDNQNERSRDA